MAEKPKKDSDWFSWALIVFLFAVDLFPLALLLLFWKLFAPDKKQKTPQAPPLQVDPTFERRQRETARQAGPADRSARRGGSRAKTAAKKVVRSPTAGKSNARWLKIVGAIVAVAGIVMAAEPLGMLPYASDWLGLWMEDFLTALAPAFGGMAMFFSGVSMDRQLKRNARYLAVMGDMEAIDLDVLARKLGFSRRRVEKDLQKMIEKGYFGGKAYVNMELGYFFRSSQADAAFSGKQAEEQQAGETASQTEQEAESEYARILRNIRRANDDIADPVLSAKIQRLEDITAKIFQAVEEDPQKRDRIDTFLHYYLPTTQKLLDSYAKFEAAGVEGENLRQAKERIEQTMDSIVAGFAHQLDQLYQADAMDVDSDIRVMETMLHRDTASAEKDFGLGGTAVQREEE